MAKPKQRPLAKAVAKSLVQDEYIMGTNNSSITSKRSVEKLYFPNEPHFFNFFTRFQRRSPLVNRGYWLRMRAVDHVVRQFLEEDCNRTKVIVNLGAGYDPLIWQCHARYPDSCSNTCFIDIDYKDLMLKKRAAVMGTPELKQILTNIESSDDSDVLLRSDQYVQLGCDLRDLKSLEKTLSTVINIEDCIILFTAEVSITYMDTQTADALIAWAGALPDSRFCLLEQIIPEGENFSWARTMIAHFKKMNAPIQSVLKYPNTIAQEKRFIDRNWKHATARNLWDLWGSSDFLSDSERMALDLIEPFDEWEEFALFGCHYFLLVAQSGHSASDANRSIKQIPPHPSNHHPASILMEYAKNTENQNCRRFAATIPLQGRDQDTVAGVFGGMGQNSRLQSIDVWDAPEHENGVLSATLSSIPSSRMCHTITNLTENEALLVGGRASPDKALADCWLFRKDLNTWEQVCNIPVAQYRHSAVAINQNLVLVGCGKTDSRNISNNFWVWNHETASWNKCEVTIDNATSATYEPVFGAIMAMTSEIASDAPVSGFIAGGMLRQGRISKNIWTWELRNASTDKPLLKIRSAPQPLLEESNDFDNRHILGRFGASSIRHLGKTIIVGGICYNSLLSPDTEVCAFDGRRLSNLGYILDQDLEPNSRPLLIGISLYSKGQTLMIMGGGAVCYAFGTFWNRAVYKIQPAGPEKPC